MGTPDLHVILNSVSLDVTDLARAALDREREGEPGTDAQRIKALINATDRVRKQLAGFPPERQDPAEARDKVLRLVSRCLVWLAYDELARGEETIDAELDATMTTRGDKRAAGTIKRYGEPMEVVVPVVPKSMEGTVIRHGSKRLRPVEAPKKFETCEAPRVRTDRLSKQKRAPAPKAESCAVHGTETRPDPRNNDCTCDANNPWPEPVAHEFDRSEDPLIAREHALSRARLARPKAQRDDDAEEAMFKAEQARLLKERGRR